MGFRGIYNFGVTPENISSSSRLSLGGELYYSVLAKAPGISAALRYTDQSAYTGTPLTMTLMCNPLMGHIAAMYSLSAGQYAFGSRFEFNAYSYESDLSVGYEVFRQKPKNVETPVFSVFKVSTSLKKQSLNLLCEGRFKELLVSTGLGLALSNQGPEIRGFGISLQYSS